MSVEAYYLWSPTCNPCKVISLHVEELKTIFSSVDWHIVNIYEDKNELTTKYKVSVVPTIVVIAKKENGEVIYTGKHSGTDMLGYYRILRTANQQVSK